MEGSDDTGDQTPGRDSIREELERLEIGNSGGSGGGGSVGGIRGEGGGSSTGSRGDDSGNGSSGVGVRGGGGGGGVGGRVGASDDVSDGGGSSSNASGSGSGSGGGGGSGGDGGNASGSGGRGGGDSNISEHLPLNKLVEEAERSSTNAGELPKKEEENRLVYENNSHPPLCLKEHQERTLTSGDDLLETTEEQSRMEMEGEDTSETAPGPSTIQSGPVASHSSPGDATTLSARPPDLPTANIHPLNAIGQSQEMLSDSRCNKHKETKENQRHTTGRFNKGSGSSDGDEAFTDQMVGTPGHSCGTHTKVAATFQGGQERNSGRADFSSEGNSLDDRKRTRQPQAGDNRWYGTDDGQYTEHARWSQEADRSRQVQSQEQKKAIRSAQASTQMVYDMFGWAVGSVEILEMYLDPGKWSTEGVTLSEESRKMLEKWQKGSTQITPEGVSRLDGIMLQYSADI